MFDLKDKIIYQKNCEIKDLNDKLHRRNMQIADLRKQIVELKQYKIAWDKWANDVKTATTVNEVIEIAHKYCPDSWKY